MPRGGEHTILTHNIGRPLSKIKRVELAEFIVEKMPEDLTTREVADLWNLENDEDFHVTAQNVGHMQRQILRARLIKCVDKVEDITHALLERLAAVALADPRDVVTWDEDGVVIVDSENIPEHTLAGLKISAKSGGELEVSHDPSASMAAAKELLTFMHGKKQAVDQNHSRVVAKLTAVNDRVGLERIIAGEDPMRVLFDRLGFIGRAEAERDIEVDGEIG